MKDIHYHGTFTLHGFEDPFPWKKSAKDDSSKFFEFISPIISTWVHYVLKDMPNFIPTRTLEDLLHGSKPVNYRSDW